MEKDYIIQHKLKQARDFESQGKFLHSIQIYHSLINQFPDFLHAYLSLATLYEQCGGIGSADDVFKKIISEGPDDDEMRLFYAQFLIRNMKWTDVVNVLNEVNPETEPIVSFFTGSSYMFMGEYELAKVHFLKFIISDEAPELIHDAYLFLAKIELKLKQFDNALKYLRKAEVMLDDYWELYILYSKIYFEQGMNSHSLNYLLKLSNSERNNPSVHYWISKVYLTMDEFKKAEVHLTRYLDLTGKKDSRGFLEKAKKMLKSGNLKEALLNFEMAETFSEKKKFIIKAQELNNARINSGFKKC